MHTEKTSVDAVRVAGAWRIILLLLPFLICNSRADAQWPNGYVYRGAITVAHGQVPTTDQTNFPVLVSGTYPDLASTANGGKVANSNGYDIVFASDLLGLNKLNFERESYSPATGNILFWVQTPVLSHTTDTVIYVFYGNPSVVTDQSNPAGVWDSNYLGVWHLDGSPAGPAPQEIDSTSGGNNLTAVGSWAPVNSAPGQIGGSVYSNFNQGFSSSSAALTPATTMTVSAWINTTVGGGVPTIMSQYDFIGESAGYYLIVNGSSGHLRYKISAGNNGGTPQTTFDALTGTINDGVWHYVAATYTSGSNPSLYVDGIPVAAPPTNGGINGIFQGSLANSTPFLMADFNSYYYQGYLDEARLSRVARSADWIAAEYHNQYSPSTFYSTSWGQMASPSSPWLVALPGTLFYARAAGSANPAPQQVTISTNASTGTLNWMATATQPWIQFSTQQNGPFTPTLSGVGTQAIWMQAAIGGITSGSYSGAASIAAAGAVGSPQTISVSLSLSQPLPSLAWPNGYYYSGTITVSHLQVPNTDQSNFPVLVSGVYPALATATNGGQVTNANGYDIIFTSDSAGMKPLNFERQSYSPVTGQVVFWVQLPTLSHATDTTFYMFYCNPSVALDPSNKTAVWDANYAGVWHMDDNAASPTVSDSSGQGNNGTATVNTSSKTTSGMVGSALSFNGGSDQVTTSVVSGRTFTWEAWVNSPVMTSGKYQSVLTLTAGSYMLMDAQLGADSMWSTDGLNGALLGTTGLANNTWYHLAFVRSGDSSASGYTAYVNGVQKGQAVSGAWGGAGNLTMGARPGTTGQNLGGSIDEVRVSNTVRSADWIATEYHNQSSPSAFYSATFGLTYGSITPPAISVSSGTLTYTGTAGSTLAAQMVTVGSSNSTPLGSWIATVNPSFPWITISTSMNGTYTNTASGLGTSTIYVQVATGSLPAGGATTNGLFTITASGANPSMTTVNVAVTVNSSTGTTGNTYQYTGTITVSHLQVPNTDQTNFPVLVSGIYPALATTANGGQVTNANGYDIVFTSDSAGMIPLPFERQSYSPATGQVVFWVQLPTLSHSSDTTFYIFYGNPSITTDQSNKTAVWDPNYSGVWHMDDNAASAVVNDSSSKGNNGTAAANTNAKTTLGIVGNALSFNGSTDQVTTSVVSGKTFTWEAWVNSSIISSTVYQSILTLAGSSYMLMDVQSGADSLWSPEGLNGSVLGITGLGNNTWYHLAFVRSGDSSASGYTAYLNGVAKGQTSSGGWSSTANLTMGARIGVGGQNLAGMLDEVRVSNTVRSADWIATEYHNQSSPSTFYSAVLGLPNSGGTSTPPALSVSSGTLTYTGTAGSPNPVAQSVNVTSSNSTPLGSWIATVNPSFPWITISTILNGTYTNTASGLGTSTIYVQVATGSLPAGGVTTNGSFTVMASGANPSMEMVNVGVTVNSSTGTTGNTYKYSGMITVSHLQVPNTDQTNFPVLVSGTYPALATISNGGQVTSSNGYDIVFTSDSAGLIPLPFERQGYSPATGQVAFWVQLPTLSHSSDTTFYIFYGNSSITTDQSNKTAVWDSNYAGVWHMDDNAASAAVNDSSSKGNNGTAAASTSAKTTPGIVGNALSFNGSTDQVTTSVVSGKTFTWEAWVNSSIISSTVYQSILTLAGSAYMLMDVELGADSLWSPEGLNGSVLGITGLGNNTWYHLALVRSGDSSASGYTAYLNGVARGQMSSGGWSSAASLTMGARIGVAGQNLAGMLDEVRVSNTVRSADWITTEYHNQSSPSAFYSIVLGLIQ